MRRRTLDVEAPAVTIPPAVVIDPNGVYLAGWVRSALHLKQSSLRREIREGRLAVSKRCGRYYTEVIPVFPAKHR
jgi:hypothetical protein